MQGAAVFAAHWAENTLIRSLWALVQAGRWFRLGLAGLVAAALVIGCQPQLPETDGDPSALPQSAPQQSAVMLLGTGASFPMIFYTRLFSEYNRLHPTVQVNYQDTGSAAGIQQMIAATVDFAGSDVAMTDEDIDRAPEGIVMIPMTAGSIVLAYNLPGLEAELRLSREAYADIFLGNITRWDDPAIAATNPDILLPDLPIVLVHRSDGSGSTAAFTAHLSAISSQWESEVGAGLNVSWPAGVGIKSNAGVSAQILQEGGAIGYVEYSYAQRLEMPMAVLENQSGNFVAPTIASAQASLLEAQIPDDLRVFIPDPVGAEAYPIVTYSWLLLYDTYADPDKAAALKAVVQWGLTEAQSFSEELGYVPLPEAMVERAMVALEQVQS